MAKPLQSIAIQAPAFFGLNTQDSPTSLTEQFALVADNCVIDQFGRIGARKGWEYTTTTNPASLVHISEYIKPDTTTEIISASSTAIYKGTTTLTDITPASYTVQTGEFEGTTLNGIHYLFEEGQDPLYYDGTTCDELSAHPLVSGTVPKGGLILSSFGRLWTARTDANNTTIYWSDLLTGMKWDTGSSGSINISKVWAGGADEITGIISHNNFLIIFGRTQILIYQGASDPATMSLADSIVGTGCVATKTIQATGNDLLFLSDTGVKSLNRTIQEKSLPMRDVSKNVRTELLAAVAIETGLIKSVYNAREAFYVITLPDTLLTYCFDTRTPLEDGSYRATKWSGMNPKELCSLRDGTLYLGMPNGIGEYKGYTDDGTHYQLSYFSNYIDFGAPSNLKLLKNLKITIIGGSATDVTLNWGYDYSYAYNKRKFTLSSQVIAEYNIAEYNTGEFNAGVLVNRPNVNANGGGQVVQLGVEADVFEAPLSIQRMTAQAIIGRTI